MRVKILRVGIVFLLLLLLISGGFFIVSAECPCKNKDLPLKSEVLSSEETRVNPLTVTPTNSSSSDQLPLPDTRSLNISPTGINPLSASSEAQCQPSTSGTTGAAETDTSWPSPVITSLYPDSLMVGSGSCTLTIDGINFIPETRVLWDIRDYTKKYLSPYQLTADIPASELVTPGLHYIQIYNPTPCGGNSNIVTFPVKDNGQSFPLTTIPLALQILKGHTGQAAILVQDTPKGLLRYNLTLMKDPSSPYSFFFSALPSWVSDPQVTWLESNRLLISGGDASDRIRDGSRQVILANISIVGSTLGSGQIQCTLNEAIADDGTRYGSGYTAIPVTIGEIIPFPNPSGGMFPPSADPDGDGLYEDINGNGRLDLNDIVIFFTNSEYVIQYEPGWLFDYDRNGIINLNDVVTLFRMTII